jgi:hypothetical protein
LYNEEEAVLRFLRKGSSGTLGGKTAFSLKCGDEKRKLMS